MGVASGCGCKEVYRFPHITYPYSSCIPIQILPGGHKVVTTLSQPCHNLVIGLSVPYKVVTTLSQPCNRIISTLQGCGS